MDIDILVQLRVVDEASLCGTVLVETRVRDVDWVAAFYFRTDAVSVDATISFYHPLLFVLAGEFRDSVVCTSEEHIVSLLDERCLVLSAAFRATQCAIECLLEKIALTINSDEPQPEPLSADSDIRYALVLEIHEKIQTQRFFQSIQDLERSQTVPAPDSPPNRFTQPKPTRRMKPSKPQE